MSAERNQAPPPPRPNERSPVTPFEIKGRIVRANAEASVMLIWNISDAGLCLWVTSRLAVGEIVAIEITQPWALQLTAEVRWSRAVEGRSGFLVGLVTCGGQPALAEIHRAIRDGTG